MKKRLLPLVLFGTIGSLKSQSLVSASGGIYQDSELQIEWTLGEMRNEQFSSPDFSVSEGQQQNAMNVVTLIKDFNESSGVNIYPNPTLGTLQLKNGSNQPLSFTLIGPNGQTLKEGTFNETKTLFLQDHPNGVYFIRIQDPVSQLTNSFNIIKN